MEQNGNGDLVERAIAYYREHLKTTLEAEHLGEAVAIHVDTGDYAIGRNHTYAMRALRQRHEPDGRMVVLTIGPPTESDRYVLALAGGTKE